MPADKNELSPSIKALIGEAASEGFEGMYRVAKVIHTRAKQRNLDVDSVVTQPKQFSAMERADLDDFIAKQPKKTMRDAHEAMNRAASEIRRDNLWANHYVTKNMMKNPNRPKWINKMKLVEEFGNHVFLRE